MLRHQLKIHHQASFVRSSLQSLTSLRFFEWLYFFQLCSFKNTLVRLSQVYTSKARLGSEISDVNMHKCYFTIFMLKNSIQHSRFKGRYNDIYVKVSIIIRKVSHYWKNEQ